MSIQEVVAQKMIKENFLVFTCDRCGKTSGQIQYPLMDKELEGWVQVTPMAYTCDSAYHKHFCENCAANKLINVGHDHEAWYREQEK